VISRARHFEARLAAAPIARRSSIDLTSDREAVSIASSVRSTLRASCWPAFEIRRIVELSSVVLIMASRQNISLSFDNERAERLGCKFRQGAVPAASAAIPNNAHQNADRQRRQPVSHDVASRHGSSQQHQQACDNTPRPLAAVRPQPRVLAEYPGQLGPASASS